MTTPYRLLTIAGSDSGGGAGIQADLKTFQSLGCYGMTVITALTAQNTRGVKSVYPVPANFVGEQIEAVFEDLGVDALKIGMVYSPLLVEKIVDSIERWNPPNIVVDPVMVAKGGSRLLEEKAINALRERLLPTADLVTPNIPEAEILTELPIETRAGMERAAEAMLRFTKAVVLKGGHLPGSERSPDLFLNLGGERLWIERPRIKTQNTHGTGCTYSAAIACYRAKGLSWREAVEKARGYLHHAIESGAQRVIGTGQGPVHHAWNLREGEF